jgi:hypothetical protein
MENGMRNALKVLFGTACLGVSTLAPAAPFDGSVPMLCAVTDTVSCDSKGECVEGPAEAVNLPVFLKVNVANKTAQSVRQGGEQRTSKILSVHEEADALVLLGVEASGGWSAAIGERSGKLTLTVAEEGMGYIVFGTCTTL